MGRSKDGPTTRNGPLHDVVVVDLTWGLAGSLAGMLLADYGATVVKAEKAEQADASNTGRRGGNGRPDSNGSVLRSVVERGKWSVDLDPDDADDAATLEALLVRADVLLHMSAAAPSGALSAAAVAERHPHLIDGVITGYGLEGPFSDRPGYDALVAARLGMMIEQPGHRAGPIFLGHPSIAYVTAHLAVIGILAALHVRHRTGRGQGVDTSMLDGALAVNLMNWWYNEHGFSYLVRTGDEEGFGRKRLITDLFECGDGEYLMIHTGGDGGFKRMMDLLGFADIVRDVGGLEMSVPLDDAEYHAARHLVPEALRTRAREEWIKLFHAADLAALPVLRPEEIFHDEQVAHAGVVVEVDDPAAGRVRQIGPVVHFAASPAPPTTPAPRPGADTHRLDELLARPPVTARGTELPPSAPLAGIRVVDFSSFFATAFGARLLSDLGADVVKVEPVGGDQMRPLADLFEAAQRGKRNLAVDMRTAEGVEAVRRLVATADVVMHNLRPGKAEKLGLGFEQCRALNASLIYCYLPGFGSTGPKSMLKSFAPLVSGLTGMLYIGAGDGNRPVRRVLGNEDLYNGFVGAVSVLMALAHRDATSEGQYVESPHLHSSLLMRSDQCAGADGRPRPGLRLDAGQTGWGPLYRLYQTADGWIALACVGQRAFQRLAQAIERQLPTDEEELTAALTHAFARLSSEDAFARLDAARVPCEIPVETPYLDDFLWDPWAEDTGRVFAHQHPEHGYIREIGNCVRLSATPLANKGPSARLGHHTRAVLEELDYQPDEIEQLLEGVCRE
jgi:crotonobetainyl-CoA:carnitine CoA-transferase CaiB-like acyl-CoA transferase